MSGQVQATSTPSSPFHARFLEALKQTGWTNQEAARELGVSERQITRWRGGQEPRYGMVLRWSIAFGRPIGWFYEWPA